MADSFVRRLTLEMCPNCARAVLSAEYDTLARVVVIRHGQGTSLVGELRYADCCLVQGAEAARLAQQEGQQ